MQCYKYLQFSQSLKNVFSHYFSFTCGGKRGKKAPHNMEEQNSREINSRGGTQLPGLSQEKLDFKCLICNFKKRLVSTRTKRVRELAYTRGRRGSGSPTGRTVVRDLIKGRHFNIWQLPLEDCGQSKTSCLLRLALQKLRVCVPAYAKSTIISPPQEEKHFPTRTDQNGSTHHITALTKHNF